MATPAVALASDRSAWDRVLALHARVERELAQALQTRHGLALSDYRSLEHLAASSTNELRMQELADKVGLNQSSVTRLVSRLETAGYAYKDLCPSDKRGVYAVITPEGRERHAQARATYAEVLSATLNQHATDPTLAPTVQALRTAR
ncbi:MarR family transcriptional regulator [Kribbella sandramycini]|uniref:MarR family transcriptional regulator n=1 Tax=Kribbella sandramycini TaxID=60450 RepID=A0A7Y4NZ81_9ACTN|nr:MarR family transcriptional regulator [Kribbella sandramycini]MBB6567488.1 DNA-binding MarR family transcriptional regulator [Kribbella sandramycini]NOL39905.1 MarR family transcriptional regulator [Kribbella sandramycini]